MSTASQLASMSPAMIDSAIAGTTRARATKATKRESVKAAKSTVKKSWHVSPEGVKRLGVHATMEGRSESAIVDELLLGLNRYTMPAANNRANRAPAPSGDVQDDRHDGQAA